MSHFTVLVTGLDYESALAPFDENLVVDPYVKYTRESLIAKERGDFESFRDGLYAEYLSDPKGYAERVSHNPGHLAYIRDEFPKRFEWTDEQFYQNGLRWYEPDEITEDGSVMSTYNPLSKWDWYQVGGRWDGGLVTRFREDTNATTLDNIDWNETYPTFAVLHDGEWHQRGNMGWFGISTDNNDDWESEFKALINSLPGDTWVTLIDAHI